MYVVEYKELDGISLPISRIVFGNAIPAMIMGQDESQFLNHILELGINTFETARVYGEAERVMGNWMSQCGCRDKVIIIDKGAHPLPDTQESRVNPKAIQEDLNTSLEALQTDYVDLYLLHRDDKKQPVGPLIEKLNELKENGKIRLFGVSNWTVRRIEEAEEYAYQKDLEPFAISSVNYGLAQQVLDPWGGGCVSISGPENVEDRRWYLQQQLPVLAYSPLAHGLMSGKIHTNELNRVTEVLDSYSVRGYCCRENYERLRRAELIAEKKKATVAQVVLSWLLNQPLEPYVVLSASTAERMEENCKALDLELTREEMQYLNLE